MINLKECEPLLKNIKQQIDCLLETKMTNNSEVSEFEWNVNKFLHKCDQISRKNVIFDKVKKYSEINKYDELLSLINKIDDIKRWSNSVEDPNLPFKLGSEICLDKYLFRLSYISTEYIEAKYTFEILISTNQYHSNYKCAWHYTQSELDHKCVEYCDNYNHDVDDNRHCCYQYCDCVVHKCGKSSHINLKILVNQIKNDLSIDEKIPSFNLIWLIIILLSDEVSKVDDDFISKLGIELSMFD